MKVWRNLTYLHEKNLNSDTIMELQFTSDTEFLRVLNQPTLSINDRYKLDAFPFVSLTHYCSDLSANEIGPTRLIEEKNLNSFFNILMAMLGVQCQEQIQRLISTDLTCIEIIKEVKKKSSGIDRDCILLKIFTKYMLSSIAHSRDITKPTIQGKMPQKMFSFRQSTADEWFNKIVTIKLESTAKVYRYMGREEAVTHVFSSFAHSFYNFNPSKYDISRCPDTNEAIYTILKSVVGGEFNPVASRNQNGEVLFKDL